MSFPIKHKVLSERVCKMLFDRCVSKFCFTNLQSEKYTIQNVSVMIINEKNYHSAADVISGIGLHDRIGGIYYKKQNKKETQCHTEPDCHMVVKLVENRLKDADKENAAKSEADSACKADIAVEVQ